MGKFAFFMMIAMLTLGLAVPTPAFAANPCAGGPGRELFVQIQGSLGKDSNPGTRSAPLRHVPQCSNSSSGVYYLLNPNGGIQGGPYSLNPPSAGNSGAPLPTPVLYSLLAAGAALIFASGLMLQRRGQHLAKQN